MTDVLALLIEERDRLNQAIAVLQGPKRRGRPPGSGASAQAAGAKPAAKKRKRRVMSADQKAVVSLRMKKYWAARRKAKKG